MKLPTRLVLMTGLLLTLMAAACSPASVPELTATIEAASETPLPPTETPPPTATLEPTVTTTPTATPIPPLGLVEGGDTIWCLPATSFSALPTSEVILPDGMAAVVEDGLLTAVIPDKACVFVYQFNQPIPAGIKLQVFDNREAAWLEEVLSTSSSDPATGYAILDHAYVVNPPFWFYDYTIKLVSVEGVELYNRVIHFRRPYMPEPCWNGTLPNPFTLQCPLKQDLHPWDPGYGVPCVDPNVACP